ncbi:hypothetical protein M199_gp198 [Halogranum tailed virus 1]|uniref:Uncharacterized protein n=1 Tax=Halogranum tailed virus 1 TaxID=1273749 RepID=R4TMR3_9CAUD|nr:hypothetical protein M199_gp198 [Halogranum tailed virus 1]AGM11468.1 hypothetical protein HGTV1_171 [Halogranum tailed virus 1]
MNRQDLQVLMYAVKFGGQSYGTDASHGLEELYGVELSDDMARLVDMLYNLPDSADNYEMDVDANVHLGIKMVRALSIVEPESVEDATEYVEALNRFVPVVKRDAPKTALENEADDAFDMMYLASVVAANPNGQVYMGYSSFHPDKVAVVHDIHDENAVIGVERTEEYDEIGELFGWEKLRDVSLAPGAMKGMGVSENTRQDILGRSGTLTDWIRSIKFHLGRLV